MGYFLETWCILLGKISEKIIFRKRKMKCDKCKNKPWRECCNDCKELDYCCYICKDIVKVKDYIKHLGDHYANPNQYLECNMCKVYNHISFFRFRNGRCRLCI